MEGFLFVLLLILKLMMFIVSYQISDMACNIFDETMRQDRLPINMSVDSEPMLLPAYIEDCRMKLWDHAFIAYFRGSDSFKKGDDFLVFNASELIVRRVLFRYVSKYQLIHIKVHN